MDRKFILTALGYAIIGMLLGIHMAESKNHVQHVTHAHIMLLGFVVSFIYGIIYKLWLSSYESKLAQVQYWFHQVGTVLLVIGLFLLYGGFVAEATIGPVLGIGSILALISMICMKVMFIKQSRM